MLRLSSPSGSVRACGSLAGLTAGLAVALASPILRPASLLAASGKELNDTARQITVLIQGANPGSGLIVTRDGDRYFVLTRKQVVRAGDRYQIITADKTSHLPEYQQVKVIPALQLAVLSFRSRANYGVAHLANSDTLRPGATVFVSGWPNPGPSIRRRIRQFTAGQLSARLEPPLADGLALVYTNATLTGMAGGPLLDAAGRVVGIHARSGSEAVDPQLVRSGIGQPPAEPGLSFGIPINAFIDQAPQSGLDLGLRADNTPAPDLALADVPPSPPDKQDTIDNINKLISNFRRGLGVFKGIRGFFR